MFRSAASSPGRLSRVFGGGLRPWSGLLAVMVSLAVGLFLVWQLVQLLWLVLVGPEVEPAPIPPVPQVQPPTAGRDGFRWDLFGESGTARPVRVPTAPARTDLQLRGLMSGGDGAFAIIADARGSEQVYRIGDELPDGSRLISVEPLQAVLERDGRREALALDRKLPRQASAARTTGSAGARPPAASRLPGVRGFQAPAGISAASLQRPGVDGSGFANQISVLPVAGGGFRVRPGRDASLFAELGLQVNDVVTAVNGQRLTSREEAQALFADVLRRGEVSITINRQGREMTLRPDLEQILSRIE